MQLSRAPKTSRGLNPCADQGERATPRPPGSCSRTPGQLGQRPDLVDCQWFGLCHYLRSCVDQAHTPPTTATHQLASDCRTSADGAQPTSDNRSEFAIPGSVEASCVLILMCFTAADVHRSEVLESGCQKSNMGCSPGHSWAGARGGDWRPTAVSQSGARLAYLAGGAHGALNT